MFLFKKKKRFICPALATPESLEFRSAHQHMNDSSTGIVYSGLKTPSLFSFLPRAHSIDALTTKAKRSLVLLSKLLQLLCNDVDISGIKNQTEGGMCYLNSAGERRGFFFLKKKKLP